MSDAYNNLAEAVRAYLRDLNDNGITFGATLSDALAAHDAAHETMAALVVSTAHVEMDEAARFDEGDLPEGLHTPWAHPEYGWIFWIDDEPQAFEAEMSQGFRDVLAYARTHGLKWVRFDRDGVELPGATTYDW